MSELPSGAVTFLHTDIEGSTRLVKQLRDRWPEVLREHQRLLRAAFAAHHGHEIDTQGDSFFIAFSRGRDAVLAAVEGQLALLSHGWPEGTQLRVRMGIHTGQAVASEGGYTGLAVHRAARIAAAAHGGQVLVSQATQTLLEDEEEDLRVFLRDLGEQRLKDLDRPVRLYQVAGPDLPDDFPPVRAAAEPALPAAPPVVPVWRRPAVVVAAVVALAALVASVALVATRSSGGGLDGVQPNHVGVIDAASNRIVAEIPTGIRPGPVAAGNGSVWVGNLDDRTLTRIDAERRALIGTVSLENRTPTGIAIGAGGVWVAHGLLGQLSRVDPQFARVTNTVDVVSATPLSRDGAVAVGAGSVWVVFSDSTVARFDPVEVRLAASTTAGAVPTAVALGNRSLWVVNSRDSSVWRYNPETFEEGPTKQISVGQRAVSIASGEGAIWVANAGDDTVTRIDPTTAATRSIAVGREPVAVAVGGGAVWVANRRGRSVSRIDPDNGDVVQTIEVGSAPAGIAVDGDVVWVTAQAP
jgi:YVTN family beta-propeller protein